MRDFKINFRQQMEIQRLKRENKNLREGDGCGAVGGAPLNTNPSYNRPSNVARDLRLAASTAENNLR